MLRALRQSLFGQLFLGAVVAAIIAAFLLSGGSNAGAVKADECAVEVGPHCVAPKDFIAAYGLLTAIGINEQAAKRLDLRRAVALGLAERTVLVEQARALGIETSEADVDRDLVEGRTRLSLPASGAERMALSVAACVDGPGGCEPGTIGLRALPVKREGAFNFEVYKRWVRNVTGRSPNHFKEMQQLEHTAERMRQVVRGQVRVSEKEAFLAYQRARSEATVRVARLSSVWFSRYAVAADAAALSAFRAAHEAELKAAVTQTEPHFKDGCRVLTELRLAPRDGEDAAAAKLRLEGLVAKAKLSRDLERLVRLESSAPSAALGGRLGCVDAASYGPEAELLLGAASELRPGDYSAVFETAGGPAVVRLDAVVTPENRAALALDFALYRLAHEGLAKESMAAFADSLKTALRTKRPMPDALAELTRELLDKGPFAKDARALESAPDRPLSDISRPFSIEGSPLDDAAPGQRVAPLVFALGAPDEVLEAPVATLSGVAVLQLKSKDEVTKEQFAADRERVLADLRARKAEQALAEYVSRLITAAGGAKLSESYVPTERPGDEPSKG